MISRKFLPYAIVVLFVLTVPNQTRAAFNLDLVSQNGDGDGYSTTNNPTYSENNGFIGGSSNVKFDPVQSCRDVLEDSGLSDEDETYCVYDAQQTYFYAGGCFYTTAGICTGTQPTSNSPQDSWPPSASDNPTQFNYEIQVSIYQSELRYWPSLADMREALDAYIYGLGPDPGYDDVCSISHHPVIAFEAKASACNIYHHDGTQAAPVATLTANPASIVSGNASALSYTCTNGATSASINNGVGAITNPASGTKSVTPTATTTYTLTCTNNAGSATDTATVTVTPALTASCSVAPPTITSGGSATWTATASGGTGTYSYAWSGTDGLQGRTGNPVTVAYPTSGTKTGSVTVTSGTQTVTRPCTNSVTVNPAPPGSLSCSVSNTSPDIGDTITYTASGATAPYTWTASGGGNYGTANTATRTISAAGTYTMTVSKSEFTSDACPSVTPNAAAGQPDLIASNTSSGTATVGDPVTLSATITNQGPAGTGAAFTDLFQRATNASGANATDIGTDDNPARGPGIPFTARLSYTFATAGTFYTRACADKDSAGDSGGITESNENNNCSAWTRIVVSPEVVTLACTVDDRRPVVGENVTYTASGGTGAYTWDAADNNTDYGSGSTVTRSFDAPGNYSMTVTNSGNTRTCPAVVARNPGEPEDCGDPSGELSASPERVREGSTSTLSFSATGVDQSCTITGPTVNHPITPTSCLVDDDTIETGGLETQSTFILECDGEEVDRAVVNVVPSFDEF